MFVRLKASAILCFPVLEPLTMVFLFFRNAKVGLERLSEYRAGVQTAILRTEPDQT